MAFFVFRGDILICFKELHPMVSFMYFVLVIGLTMFLLNPICIIISLVLGFIYSALLKGKSQALKNILLAVPMVLVMGIMNPLFNHRGQTIILYFPSGNPLTLESIIFGIITAMMIFSVILWFISCNDIITSDKYTYLFGKVAPSLALAFSMIMRFVPRLVKDGKKIISVRASNLDYDNGVLSKIKLGSKVISSLIMISLENSIDTADSMKSRGYGVRKRTSFAIYKFTKIDAFAMILILLFGGIAILGKILGYLDYSYFPVVKGVNIGIISMGLYIDYFLLVSFPVVLSLTEVIRWRILKSRI